MPKRRHRNTRRPTQFDPRPGRYRRTMRATQLDVLAHQIARMIAEGPRREPPTVSNRHLRTVTRGIPDRRQWTPERHRTRAVYVRDATIWTAPTLGTLRPRRPRKIDDCEKRRRRRQVLFALDKRIKRGHSYDRRPNGPPC